MPRIAPRPHREVLPPIDSSIIEGRSKRCNSAKLRGEQVPLNHGAACADTYHAGGFEGSAPKPTPPGEHIPPGGVVHFEGAAIAILVRVAQ